MKYGYYIKIGKGFNLTNALDLLSCQKYNTDSHTFTKVYNTWKRKLDCNYLVIHDHIFEPEYYNSDDLKSLLGTYSNRYWKWTELKLNYKDLGEL